MGKEKLQGSAGGTRNRKAPTANKGQATIRENLGSCVVSCGFPVLGNSMVALGYRKWNCLLACLPTSLPACLPACQCAQNVLTCETCLPAGLPTHTERAHRQGRSASPPTCLCFCLFVVLVFLCTLLPRFPGMHTAPLCRAHSLNCLP